MEKTNISPEVREARRAKMHQRAEESRKMFDETLKDNGLKEALSGATEFETLTLKDFAKKVED